MMVEVANYECAEYNFQNALTYLCNDKEVCEIEMSTLEKNGGQCSGSNKIVAAQYTCDKSRFVAITTDTSK